MNTEQKIHALGVLHRAHLSAESKVHRLTEKMDRLEDRRRYHNHLKTELELAIGELQLDLMNRMSHRRYCRLLGIR